MMKLKRTLKNSEEQERQLKAIPQSIHRDSWL